VQLASQHVSEDHERWEPPELTYLGRIAEVVAGGGGKLTFAGGDPGEPRKQKPTG
jgi:hypothetical protein